MPDALTSPTYALDDGVAVITLDDGKANAISHDVLDGFDDALDRAITDGAGAVVVAGRDGRFSAGFDLATMTASVEGMQSLVNKGARLFARLYGYRLPTVAACTGHALAAGAILLLSCDHRVGADVPAKIGLNEVAIGLPLPIFAVELARDRLTRREFGPATIAARIHDPAGAVEAGFLDQLVPADSVLSESIAEARRLAALPGEAYGRTKRTVRGQTIEHILATIDGDIGSLTGPTS